MEFRVAVEKDAVGKGDIETVASLPTRQRVWSLDYGGIAVWVNSKDGIPGNGDHIGTWVRRRIQANWGQWDLRAWGMIKRQPCLSGHQEENRKPWPQLCTAL